MVAKPRTPEETYGPALVKAIGEFAGLDPQKAAYRASVSYQPVDANRGTFHLTFANTDFDIQWPDGAIARTVDGHEADISTRLVLLHYMLTADGTPLASKWIAFRNLPGGMGYEAAFRGRACYRLIQTFGANRTAFDRAARMLGGEPLRFGDASYLFRILPRVWMAVVLHLADDEFPAEANVLFDASAEHYLPTEDLAVLGGILSSWLVKAGKHGT